MLLGKPFVLSRSHKKKENQVNQEEGLLNNEEKHDDQGNEHAEEHSLGEMLMHQAIETIEIVLGGVSNTASYLRLWALSLAHSQLSKVFFEKTVKIAITMDVNFILKGILFFITFFFLAAVTFAILLAMDLLECFLHTLRLHWVEFQNKFFKGDGVSYTPFSFRKNFLI